MKTTSFSSPMKSCRRYSIPQMPDTMPRSGSGKLAVLVVHHCIISAARLASSDLLVWNQNVLFVYIESIPRNHPSPVVVEALPCLVPAPVLKSIACLKIRLHWSHGICIYEKQIIPRWNICYGASPQNGTSIVKACLKIRLHWNRYANM